jgi:hypothetical protein
MVDEFNEAESEETRRKKKGEGDETGSAGQAKSDLPPAIAACMAKFGVPMAKITEILRNWKELKGESLMRVLLDIASVPARASAHLLVQYDAKRGFALVTNFLAYLSGREKTPSTKVAPGRSRPGPR